MLSNAFRPAVGSVRGMQRLSGEGCIARNGELPASPRWGLWPVPPTGPERDKRTAPEVERDGADAVRRIREPATPVREMSIELELEL